MAKLFATESVQVDTSVTSLGNNITFEQISAEVELDATSIEMYSENLSAKSSPLMDVELCLEAYQACDELDGDALTVEALSILSSLLGSPTSLFEVTGMGTEVLTPEQEARKAAAAARNAVKAAARGGDAAAIAALAAAKEKAKTAATAAAAASAKARSRTRFINKWKPMAKLVAKHVAIVGGAAIALAAAYKVFYKKQSAIHKTLVERAAQARLDERVHPGTTSKKQAVIDTRTLLNDTTIGKFYSDRAGFLASLEKIAASVNAVSLEDISGSVDKELVNKITNTFYVPIERVFKPTTEGFPDVNVTKQTGWEVFISPQLAPDNRYTLVALWQSLKDYTGNDDLMDFPANHRFIYGTPTRTKVDKTTEATHLSLDEIDAILSGMDMLKDVDGGAAVSVLERTAKELKKVSAALDKKDSEVGNDNLLIIRTINRDAVMLVTDTIVPSYKLAMQGNATLLSACSNSLGALTK